MAGEDIDLKLIIKALLDSKGFEEAQAELKKFAAAANSAKDPSSKLTDEQKKLNKELGGSRGAVADLTRVLLQNIGVTGPAGEAAKAAGTAMLFMGGGASALALAATGLVAGAAVLIPMLVTWAKSTKDTEQANKDLKDSIVGMLPELEEYIRQVPNATAELRALFQVSRDEAFRKQKEEIAKLTEGINDNRKTVEALDATEQARFRNLQVFQGRTSALTAEERKKRDEATQSIADQETKLNALLAAQEDEVLLGSQIRGAIDAERERREKLKKAIDEQRKALADQLQLERDLARESARRQQQENKERADARKKHEQDIQTAAERILAIEREGEERKKEVKDAKDAKRQEVADGIALSAQAAAALVGLFTKNKAINIVAAIADAYAAGVATLKATAGMGPWVSVPAMAMVIAAGLANVQRIRETNVGFDDPFADLVARKMGRKSAEDFAKHFGSEFSGRLPGAMAQATNVYNQTTINRGTSVGAVNYNSIVGARKTQQLKQLNRDLIAMNRLEDRTRIGR